MDQCATFQSWSVASVFALFLLSLGTAKTAMLCDSYRQIIMRHQNMKFDVRRTSTCKNKPRAAPTAQTQTNTHQLKPWGSSQNKLGTRHHLNMLRGKATMDVFQSIIICRPRLKHLKRENWNMKFAVVVWPQFRAVTTNVISQNST